MTAKRIHTKRKKLKISYLVIPLFIVLLVVLFLNIKSPMKMASSEMNLDSNAAKITFSFDDGFVSGLTAAAPVLAKYEIPGVMYVSTGCVDNTGICRSRFPADKQFLSWDELKTLQIKYKWEIGSHTQNHLPLTQLTREEQEKEIAESKKTLEQKGFNVINFAAPQGDYDFNTRNIVMKHYATHRGFKDQGMNDWLYDNSLLRVVQVQEGVSVEEVKKKIDSAIKLQQWLILVFHDIKDTPSTDPADYEYNTSNLEVIAQYVKEKQIKAVTVEDVVNDTRPNLIPNPSFEIKNDQSWVTNTSQYVTIDYESNGSYPSIRESAKIVGSSEVADLHTALIPVEPGARYEFRVFANTLAQRSGELSFVVDEYTDTKEWIRAIWLGRLEAGRAGYMTGVYTPQSNVVKTIRIQTKLTRNAQGTIYLDNYQLYRLD